MKTTWAAKKCVCVTVVLNICACAFIATNRIYVSHTGSDIVSPPLPTYVVPNVVHYVWFSDGYTPLRLHHYLSLKSAYVHIRPDAIVFHCDHEPVGQWWKTARSTIKTLRVVRLRPPSAIFGNAIVRPEHKSDVTRIEILLDQGGIYLDTDVIALRSFDPLRVYNTTMGLEYDGQPGRLNNGVIVAAKQAEFLRIWYDTYRNFTKREWDYHDSIVPYNLQFSHPRLVHVERDTINYPGGKQLDLIYKGHYDWTRNYAIHLWYRLHEFEHSVKSIKTMDTTFGEIARFVLFGNATLTAKG